MKRLITVCIATVAAGWLAVVQAAPADTAAKKTQVQQAAPAQSEQGDQEQAAPAGTRSIDEQLSELKGKVDGLDEPLAAMKSTVDKLSKIKISGYIQTQFRMAANYKDATDTTGTKAAFGTYNCAVGDFAGGKLGNGVESMFQVRRGRFKLAYETDLNQYVIQLDCVPFNVSSMSGPLTSVMDTVKDSLGRNHIVTKTVSSSASNVFSGGGVSIKDVYLRCTEPWLKSFAIKAGVYDRPFGFEIGYSSSNRESPERSRLFQTLFPGERDLGASLEYLPSDNLPFAARLFNFKVGAFTGNGISNESDSYRDIIGRFGLSIPITDLNLGIDAGFSGYAGSVLSQTGIVYDSYKDTLGPTAGTTIKKFVKKTVNKMSATLDREYTGGDLEIYYGDVPALGGLTLRGEVIMGKQPGTSSSNASPSVNLGQTGDLYLRNFMGYYGMLVQNIDPIKSQLVFKYDYLDPNTDMAGDQVSSLADLAFGTLGLGLVYHWDENVKLMAYYDMVTNEKTRNITTKVNGKLIYNDKLPADVFTFRIQYKF